MIQSVTPTFDAMAFMVFGWACGFALGVIAARLRPRQPEYFLVNYDGLKTPEQIAERYREIRDDDLLDLDDADVQTNAPRALHQVHLKAERDALRWVLGGSFRDGSDDVEQTLDPTPIPEGDESPEWAEAVRDQRPTTVERIRDLDPRADEDESDDEDDDWRLD